MHTRFYHRVRWIPGPQPTVLWVRAMSANLRPVEMVAFQRITRRFVLHCP